MTKKQRTEYLVEARKAGDFDAIAAVLAAKPVVSGLSPTEVERWHREYEHAHHAPLITRRAKLEKARAELEAAGSRFLRIMLGLTNHDEVKRLDEAAAAAAEAVNDG